MEHRIEVFMTTETTRNLAREVAMALGWMVDCVRNDNSSIMMTVWNPKSEMIYKRRHILSAGGETPDIDQVWIWALDDNIPDYPNDLNACARDLTREGYKFHAEQLADNLWTGYYTEDEKPFAKLIGWNRSDKLAVAWCEAFLDLCKHVDGQLAKGEQS